MKPESLEPLPADLQALVDLESDGYPVDQGLQAEVLSHVEMAIQLSGPVSAGSGGRGAPGGAGVAASAGARLLAVAASAFVAGGAVGSGATLLLRQESAPVRAPQVVAPEERDAAGPERVALPPAPGASAPIGDVDAETVAPPASPRPPRPAPAPVAQGDLAREREVLDVARAALARGRPDDALAACDLHARRWARGYLAEEREVVRIQALVAAGRRSEAEQRAAEFRSAYRRSMFLPAVDAALGGGGDRPR